MTNIGFHKNDYKILTSDVVFEEDDILEEDSEIPYSEVLEKEDFALDILFYLRDQTENMSIPLFDKLNLRDVSLFLSKYDPSFCREY
jgi:hypothetical protein